MAVVSHSVRVDRAIRNRGAVFLSASLCAPSQRPELGTIPKLFNGTTEYAKTGDVHMEPPEIQASVFRPIIVLFTWNLDVG